MKIEIWKDIPGYEGRYQASSFGRIKSLERKVISRNWYTHEVFYRTVRECILRPGRYCKSGHLSVVLGKGTPGKPVHQLIMRTFVGDRPEGCDVLHCDGDPTNNTRLRTSAMEAARRISLMSITREVVGESCQWKM